LISLLQVAVDQMVKTEETTETTANTEKKTARVTTWHPQTQTLGDPPDV